ncbi:uncharacterized protein LOC108744856 isoform X3 [Agrilus planipennis]|uniref:Uncharacterized protein LOC108744856 isoform X3 n=1 Tax=Agrilus planipennis TaxID=224129 RepID=A0A1W4XV55_AGRPL|nr:uncharacterized protein LOC108744856 isoform X3 [Agrilus planipennis]
MQLMVDYLRKQEHHMDSGPEQDSAAQSVREGLQEDCMQEQLQEVVYPQGQVYMEFQEKEDQPEPFIVVRQQGGKHTQVKNTEEQSRGC